MIDVRAKTVLTGLDALHNSFHKARLEDDLGYELAKHGSVIRPLYRYPLVIFKIFLVGYRTF